MSPKEYSREYFGRFVVDDDRPRDDLKDDLKRKLEELIRAAGGAETQVTSKVGDLGARVERLERNIEQGTLLEMVTALAEENGRLAKDNEKLRAELSQAQQEKAELAKRMADLAEKVANTALTQLEKGGTCA